MESLVPVYQLKITLKWSKPPIWRRIVVTADIPLDMLHIAIQKAMGWENCHLYAFDAGVNKYSPIDPDWDDGFFLPAEATTLREVLTSVKDKMRYDYDFGDNWEHDITLEKILTTEDGLPSIKCIKAVGACPPEDCGGTPGYEYLLEILADPKHKDYKSMREWLGLKRGQHLDPKFVNLEDINKELAALFKAVAPPKIKLV